MRDPTRRRRRGDVRRGDDDEATRTSARPTKRRRLSKSDEGKADDAMGTKQGKREMSPTRQQKYNNQPCMYASSTRSIDTGVQRPAAAGLRCGEGQCVVAAIPDLSPRLLSRVHRGMACEGGARTELSLLQGSLPESRKGCQDRRGGRGDAVDLRSRRDKRR
jgi:hypothetical protein